MKYTDSQWILNLATKFKFIKTANRWRCIVVQIIYLEMTIIFYNFYPFPRTTVRKTVTDYSS